MSEFRIKIRDADGARWKGYKAGSVVDKKTAWACAEGIVLKMEDAVLEAVWFWKPAEPKSSKI